MDTYQAQRRGGKGRSATSVKDEDFVEHMLVVNSHDTVLCFTDMGKVYWLTVYDIPQASRNAKGRPIVNVLNLDEGERITTRSEEHTSELQSRPHLVCRLLLEKKKSGPAFRRCPRQTCALSGLPRTLCLKCNPRRLPASVSALHRRYWPDSTMCHHLI